MILFLATGCVKINDSSIEKIIDTTLNSKYELYNHINRGFKYYLPRALEVNETDDFNEILRTEKYKYYLYIDLVSYYNKVEVEYVVNNKLYYSKMFEDKKGKKGVLNIEKVDSNDYLITMIYNYAKVETIVNKEDIKESVANISVILSSIKYNDDVINNMLGVDIMSSVEEQVNPFERESINRENYLEVDASYSVMEDKEHDPDMVD